MLNGIKKVCEELKAKLEELINDLEGKSSEDKTGSDNQVLLNNAKHSINKALVEAQVQVANTQIVDPNQQVNVGVGQVNPGQQTPVTPGNDSAKLSDADKAKLDADKKAKDAKDQQKKDSTNG